MSSIPVPLFSDGFLSCLLGSQHELATCRITAEATLTFEIIDADDAWLAGGELPDLEL